jgi:anaerobic magnesium-protoporphyrin IX monomethyl ester cyclase
MKIALLGTRKETDSCFPIGLLSLAAFLKKFQPHHQIDIIEAAFEDPIKKAIEGQYDLVGITAMTPHYETATQYAKSIKATVNVPIILGGVHISKLPESLRDCFDVGVIGEGEQTFCELVALFERNPNAGPADLANIQGLVYREGNVLRQTPPSPIVDLKDYPHLDYSLVHPSYFETRAAATYVRFGVESYLMTSRGCPFKCVFCASSHFWNRVRYFEPEWVIEEIKSLAARGSSLITIADDLFACNKKRIKIISDLICAEKLQHKLVFACSGKTGVTDDDICQILRQMNVQIVFFGFESGNPRTLHYLKCGTGTMKANYEAVKLCRRHGLQVWGNVIIGSPGESIEEMEDSIRFIQWVKKNGGQRMCVAILIPFPGTPVWDEAVKKGIVGVDMNFDRLAVDAQEIVDGMMVDKKIKTEFIKLRNRAYKEAHSFKWQKAFRLLRNNPVQFIKMAFDISVSWKIARRLLQPTAP